MQPFRQPLPEKSKIETISSFDLNFNKTEPYWHYHKQIELLYIIEGSGQRLVGDSRGRFSSGELLLLGEDLPHDFSVDSDADRCRIMVIHFNSEFLDSIPELHLMRELIEKSKLGLIFKSISQNIKQGLKGFDKLDPSSQFIKLLSVLDELTKNSHINPPARLSTVEFTKYKIESQRYEKLNRVLAYIHEKKQDSLSVDMVADFSNMTSSAFCRWFKKSMTMSFLTYLNTIRIDEACRLLVNSDLQITQVATESGFDSLSSFNRNFTKLKHQSPSEYRKSLSAPIEKADTDLYPE